MQLGRWETLHAFVARATGAPLVDGKLCALWALREALEVDRPSTKRAPETKEQTPGQDDNTAVSMDALLPAAFAYLEYCPALVAVWSLRSHLFAQEEDDNLGALCEKETGIAKNGYSIRRWRFWQHRVQEIAGMKDEAGGREKVAKLAYKALEQMNEQDRQVMIASDDLKSLHGLDVERWGKSALDSSAW